MTSEKGKKRVRSFKLIAFFLPFLFFLILELALRLFGYGNAYNVFETDESERFQRLNPKVSEKYFLAKENATHGFEESFSLKKPENTFRIFVLGASTAVGFPYHHNGSFHRMLAYRLQRSYPDTDFEVINLGLTAINSYTIRDFAEAVVENRPDAVLIYAGHNEYYGALGVASTSRMGRNPYVVSFMLRLRHSRVFQLFFNAWSGLGRSLGGEVDISETLMKRMAEGQAVPKNSELYRQGIEQFEKNLDDILNTLTSENIPVFIGNLVSNLADQKPLLSHFKGKPIDGPLPLSVDETLARDSTCALAHFQSGRMLMKKKGYADAKSAFLSAKELDLFRFRAPEAMNGIIIEKTEDFENLRLVDIKSVFEKNSPDGLIGNNLVLEHLHPNYKGYYLMATSFFNALDTADLISGVRKEFSSKAIWNELPFLEIDSLYATYKTSILREQWPFNEPKSVLDGEEPKTLQEKVAGGLAVRTIEWGDAMNTLYGHYLQEKEYRNALKIDQSLIMEFPHDVRFYERAVKLCNSIKDFDLAFFYSKKAFDLQPDRQWAQRAFISALRMDDTKKAVFYIRYAIEKGANNLRKMLDVVNNIEKLKATMGEKADNLATLQKIAENYLQIGNKRAATKYVDLASKIAPKDPRTLELKARLK